MYIINLLKEYDREDKKTIKYFREGYFTKNLKFLLQHELEEELYRVKDEAVEDVIYEFEIDKEILPRLSIKTPDQTLEILSKHPKSFCRLGDGEIEIIKGHDCPFQKYHPELARKMVSILSKQKDNLYVGLNGAYFDSPFKFMERNHKFYRTRGSSYRRFFLNVCDLNSTYLDACCFGVYFRFGDDYDFEGHYNTIRNLFKDKKITIVCGKGIFDKLTYDIFDLATEKNFIYAPAKNAFDEYDSIIERINMEVPKDHLVCIILGMTATVLAADLADMGYTAWDLGHIAKDYDCYLKKTEKTDQNMSKFWAPD